MNSSETLVILLSYLAAFLATSMALVAWQRSAFNWTRPFAVMMMALAQWSLALALELSSVTLEAMRGWRMLQIVGSSFMPVAWFVFAARYTGNDGLVSGNKRRLLYAVPIATILLAFTNSSHSFLWESWASISGSQELNVSYGTWYEIQVYYSCALALAGATIFWRTLSQARREQRWHTLAMICGVVMPLLGYLLQVSGRILVEQQNLLPYFLLASASILAWAVRHQQILELVPIARQTVLSNMTDGVLVVNNQDRLVEINPAAERIIDRVADDIVGQRIVELMPQWSELWYEAVIKGEVQTEIDLAVEGQERCYDLRLSPVYTRSGHFTGRLIVLRDITAHKKTQNELDARRQLSENLVAVARATAEDSSLQATLQNALDVTTGLTGAEYGSLFLLDSGGRVTHSILARGKTAPGSRHKIVGTVMDKGLAGWVVRHRKPALLADTNDDDRWVTFPDQPYTARSVLVVPITSGADVPGVLTLQHSQSGYFDEEDEALLRAASDQMALALHKAQLYDEQLQLARRQQTLYEALKTVGRHLEPGTVVHLATETIARLTGWPAVGILVPSQDEEYLILKAGNGVLAECEGDLFKVGNGQPGRAFMSGHTRRRLATDPEEFDHDGLSVLRNAIFVPLQHAQRRLGLLVVGMDVMAALDDEDILLAESLAETVSLAMTNAQLFKVVADEHSRLQALVESSRDGIILVGNRREILFLNHKAIELLGLDDEPEEWGYRPLIELFASLEEQVAPLVSIVQAETLRAEQDPLDEGEGEIEIRKRVLRWQNLPVRTENTAVGRLIVLQDVSNERALQRIRDDLTHTMVHDLRNPLNVVSGSLELIHKTIAPTLGKDTTQLLGIARYSIDRMLHLVNGILSISRLESGKLPLKCSELDMPSLIDQVLTMQRPLASEKDLQLAQARNGTEQAALPSVYVDVEMVERVLHNLVSNAIKFTPSGGRVSVQATRDANGDMLRVAVRDSGAGVPTDIREQLFEKFVTGVQAEKGSGLGLAFCRMAVEAHGGSIWVDSEPEQGATFFFTLPLADMAQERQ